MPDAEKITNRKFFDWDRFSPWAERTLRNAPRAFECERANALESELRTKQVRPLLPKGKRRFCACELRGQVWQPVGPFSAVFIYIYISMSCSEQSTFHGHAFDRVWSFPNCSFKASRRKKRKKNIKKYRHRCAARSRSLLQVSASWRPRYGRNMCPF